MLINFSEKKSVTKRKPLSKSVRLQTNFGNVKILPVTGYEKDDFLRLKAENDALKKALASVKQLSESQEKMYGELVWYTKYRCT